MSTEVVGLDVHDPAGMARWLRERKAACLEFYKLDSEAQQRQFLNRWQQNVLPHLAFRFGQAAEMIDDLVAECEHLRSQVPNTGRADDVSGGLKSNEIENACTHEFRPIDSGGQVACIYCNERYVPTLKPVSEEG